MNLKGVAMPTRKLTRKKKRERYDANAAAVLPIYERAKQGGSAEYLTVNQPSEPDRVAKVVATADERRQRRGTKERVLTPRHPGITIRESVPAPHQYARLKSGAIVGHPHQMNEVKAEARQSRVKRRAEFRSQKAVSHAN